MIFEKKMIKHTMPAKTTCTNKRRHVITLKQI